MSRPRILKSILMTLLSEFTNKVTPFLVLSIAQHRLGTANFGIAQWAISYMEMFVPLVGFGYGIMGAIEYASKDSSKTKSEIFSGIFALRLMHFFIISCVVLSLIFLTQADKKAPLISVLFLLLASGIETEFVHYADQSLNKRNFYSIIAKLITLAGVFFLVKTPQDIIPFMVFGSLHSLTLALLSLRRNFLLHSFTIPKFQTLKKLFLKSFPFGIQIFLVFAIDRFDILFAEKYFDDFLVGIYSGQQKLMQSLLNGTAALALVFFSDFINTQNKDTIDLKVIKALWFMLSFVSPLIISLIYFRQQILHLLYSNDFLFYDSIFTTLFLGSLFYTLFQIIGIHYLSLNGQIKKVNILLIAALGSAIFFTLNFGIPQFNLHGLALGNVMCKLILCAGLLFLAPVFRSFRCVATMCRALSPSVVMGGYLIAVTGTGISMSHFAMALILMIVTFLTMNFKKWPL